MTAGLLQALVPLFFVLALGYAAGRRHSFDSDQATGFNTLLVNFALPAMLFASTVTITRSELFAAGPVVLVLAVTYIGLMLIVIALHHWWLKRSLGEAAIAGLLIASPAAPFFGPSVVTPLYGAQSGLVIAIAALIVNITQVPLAVVLLDSASGSQGKKTSPLATLGASLRQPVVIAPVLALVLVLVGVTLPKFVESAVSLIGSTTAGVAVFASGLTLAAHKLKVSRENLLNTIGKLVLLPGLVLGLGLLLGVAGAPLSRTVLISALSSGLIGLILASRYKVDVDGAANTVLLTAIGMAAALPFWILLLPKS